MIGKSVSTEILILGFVLTTFLTGCMSRQHSRAYLMLPTNNGTEEEFSVANHNVVRVPRGRRVQVQVKDIKLGWMHRIDPRPLKNRPRPYEGLGGKDLWLVAEAYSLDNSDPLGLKERRLAFASNIKPNNESFSFLSLDASEEVIFDQIMTTSFFLQIRVYQVDYVAFKKSVYQASNRSIARLAYDAAEAAAKQTASLAAEELFSFFKDRVSEPFFVEKLLLTSGATVLLEGGFELSCSSVPVANFNSGHSFALFDIRSSQAKEGWNLHLPDKDDYIKEYLHLHTNKYVLPSSSNQSRFSREHLEKTFVTFLVKPPSVEDQEKTISQKEPFFMLKGSLTLRAPVKNYMETGNFAEVLLVDPENLLALESLIQKMFQSKDYASLLWTVSHREQIHRLTLDSMAYTMLAADRTRQYSFLAEMIRIFEGRLAPFARSPAVSGEDKTALYNFLRDEMPTITDQALRTVFTNALEDLKQ